MRILDKTQSSVADYKKLGEVTDAFMEALKRRKEVKNLFTFYTADYPQYAHDLTRQRRLSLAHALRSAGDDEVHVEDAFNAFYNARNNVDFYPDALHALERLAARWPLAALTNGNADLMRSASRTASRRRSPRAKPATPSPTRRFSTPCAVASVCSPSKCCTWATIPGWT
mgnify:CR=1 FL=1